MKQETDGTKVVRFGKYVGIIYPDIYYHFVSKLHKEHPDLVSAMQLAQCKLTDGSARDFLNRLFDTQVTKEMSMEVGYKIFYDKLEARRNTQLANEKVAKMATDEFNKNFEYKFRDEENFGKPLFPTIEEQEDRGDK